MKINRRAKYKVAACAALPLLCLPAAVHAASYYETGTGISDTGVVLDATPQVMTSYSGIENVAAGSSSLPLNVEYMNIPTVGFTLSESATAQYANTAALAASPSGTVGQNFLFSLDRDLAAGESFSVEFDFPNDWTYSEHSPNVPTNITQGFVPAGTIGQKAPAGTAWPNPFTIAGRTEFGGTGVSSPGAEVRISGTLNDGGTPDLSGVAYAPGTSFNLFHWVDDGASVSFANGNSTAVFADDGDSDGLGGALRLQNTFAWEAQTVEWVAGSAGLPAGTLFRVSLDGAALVIPEPSSAFLGGFALLLFGLRRRR